MEEKDPKDNLEESWEAPVKNGAEEDLQTEDVASEGEAAPEKGSVETLTPEEEIETEWARKLHIDYDAGEARHRAEAVQEHSAATPPPAPGAVPPPMPGPAPQPYNGNYGQPAAPSAQAIQYGHPEPMPKTYLVWAVVSMVLCCFVPGLIAVIFSSSVSSKYYARDYEGARRASEVTQYWIIASIVLGLVSTTLYLPIMMLVG